MEGQGPVPAPCVRVVALGVAAYEGKGMNELSSMFPVIDPHARQNVGRIVGLGNKALDFFLKAGMDDGLPARPPFGALVSVQNGCPAVLSNPVMGSNPCWLAWVQ